MSLPPLVSLVSLNFIIKIILNIHHQITEKPLEM